VPGLQALLRVVRLEEDGAPGETRGEDPGRSPGRQRSGLWTAPNIVTLSRLCLAPVLLALAYSGKSTAFLVVLCISLVADIVDGKLARWLGQATELGARLDSWADFATFYTTLPVCAYLLKPQVVHTEAPYFWLIVGSLVVPKLYGFVKFRKLTSYHTRRWRFMAYPMGFAAVLMFADLSIWPFRLAALLVAFVKLEEIAITTVLPRHVTMVPSLSRALEIRRELALDTRLRSSQ